MQILKIHELNYMNENIYTFVLSFIPNFNQITNFAKQSHRQHHSIEVTIKYNHLSLSYHAEIQNYRYLTNF